MEPWVHADRGSSHHVQASCAHSPLLQQGTDTQQELGAQREAQGPATCEGAARIKDLGNTQAAERHSRMGTGGLISTPN